MGHDLRKSQQHRIRDNQRHFFQCQSERPVSGNYLLLSGICQCPGNRRQVFHSEDLHRITTTSDTLYVATGPCYRTVGGNETITYLTASSSSTVPANVPVPNYYWKAVLKVKWSGKTVTDAYAIGFWFEHKAYSDKSYTDYVLTIDEIEAKIGFDLFANLPDAIESKVESTIVSWDQFKNY